MDFTLLWKVRSVMHLLILEGVYIKLHRRSLYTRKNFFSFAFFYWVVEFIFSFLKPSWNVYSVFWSSLTFLSFPVLIFNCSLIVVSCLFRVCLLPAFIVILFANDSFWPKIVYRFMWKICDFICLKLSISSVVSDIYLNISVCDTRVKLSNIVITLIAFGMKLCSKCFFSVIIHCCPFLLSLYYLKLR